MTKFLKLTTKKNKIFQDWGGVTPHSPPHRDTPAFIDSVKFANEKLKKVIEEVKPDIIIEDQ